MIPSQRLPRLLKSFLAALPPPLHSITRCHHAEFQLPSTEAAPLAACSSAPTSSLPSPPPCANTLSAQHSALPTLLDDKSQD